MSREKPTVGMHKIVKIGGTNYIRLPPDWLKDHNVEEILTIADRDIRIVNPEDTDKVYRRITDIVKDAQTTTE